MIGWLVGMGLSDRAAKLLLIVGGVLLLILAFYLALDAYGDSRYREGKKDADAAWIEASNRLVDKAHKSASKADVAAAARVEDFTAKQEDEKRKIEHAQAEGSSPFDALFGNGA